MPRYDDRHWNTRLYVGHLSSRTRTRDLERVFGRYGRVRDVDMKRDYAFVEFSDPRDADDARYHLDGRDIDGSRIIVEFSRGVPRGSREYGGRGPPPGSGRCFNCGVDGHWARDCTAGDWKNRCYRCGERGHIERDCKNSPKKLRRAGSYSRSPVRSRSPRRRRSPSHSRSRSRSRSRGRSRSYSRGRSYSRSRSPVKRERSVESERSRSPEVMEKSPPPKGRDRSASPEERSPKRTKDSSNPPSPKGSDYGGSPRENGGGNSASPEKKGSSPAGGHESPAENNGPGCSPSPRDEKIPVDDDYED